MAPLVRTGGSRHTGLAAPPHRNIQTLPSPHNILTLRLEIFHFSAISFDVKYSIFFPPSSIILYSKFGINSMKKNDFRPNSNHEPALEKFRLSNVIIFIIYNKSLNIKKLSTRLSLVPNVKRTPGNSVAFSISTPQ